jgi:hypothetical protein
VPEAVAGASVVAAIEVTSSVVEPVLVSNSVFGAYVPVIVGLPVAGCEYVTEHEAMLVLTAPRVH